MSVVSSSMDPKFSTIPRLFTPLALTLALTCVLTLTTTHITQAHASTNLSPRHDQTREYYDASWSSLDSRPIPDWYHRCKFGLFIHWGMYSVPAWAPVGTYSEWYWFWSNIQDSEVAAWQHQHFGDHWSYPDFESSFKPILFNATQWIDLFIRAGIRYVVPTSKHHDGYAMFQTKYSWNWNSVELTPKRDIIGEIRDAVKAAPVNRDSNPHNDLHFGFYYSLFEWYHPLYHNFDDKTHYVTDHYLPQIHEVVNKYEPDILWTDGEWEENSTFWRSEEFLQWLYNDSPVADRVVVNDRWGSETRGVHGGFYTAEYDATAWSDRKWEENSGIDHHSYGFNRQSSAADYFTAEDLLQLLVRCVANGGNFLLNIGPQSDGSIPSIMQERLMEIGEWMSVNSDAIYDTDVWHVMQEGQIDHTNVRYTKKMTEKHDDRSSDPTVDKDNITSIVYAFALQWPEYGILSLPSLIPTSETVVTSLTLQDDKYLAELNYKFLGEERGTIVMLPYDILLKQKNPPYVIQLTNVKAHTNATYHHDQPEERHSTPTLQGDQHHREHPRQPTPRIPPAEQRPQLLYNLEGMITPDAAAHDAESVESNARWMSMMALY